MKKKYIMIGITCCFILISGICYSCSYQSDKASSAEVTSLLEEGDKTEAELEQTDKEPEQTGEEEQTDEEPEQVTAQQQTSHSVSSTDAEMSDITSEEETIIYVHICGAVVNPGVYKAASGARVCDLIELSGGLQKEAAGDYMNQAQPVTDGQRIYIPTKEEIGKLTVAEYISGSLPKDEKQEASAELVDINTATAEELMELPGIGKTKADSIINYRTQKGGFAAIEELKEVPGIKEGLFGQISSYITAE